MEAIGAASDKVRLRTRVKVGFRPGGWPGPREGDRGKGGSKCSDESSTV